MKADRDASAMVLSKGRSRTPTGEDERDACNAWENSALDRCGIAIQSMLEGEFNLMAKNALKFRSDLEIVCKRGDPLFQVIMEQFRRYCSNEGRKVDKTTFLLRVRQVAGRCDYNADGLIATAIDVYNETQRSAATIQSKKRTHDSGG